jgi:hypothetical protein
MKNPLQMNALYTIKLKPLNIIQEFLYSLNDIYIESM